MTRRRILLLVAFLSASAAHAAWYPVFEPSYIQLRPGETASMRVHAAWLSGVSLVPYTLMNFAAEDPTVATVEGSLPTTSSAPLRVTGHRPGVTRVRVIERGSGPVFSTAPVIVVAEQELQVAIAVSGVLLAGHPITLTAVSDAPDATFNWFSGRLGNSLYTWPVGSGRELSVTPTFATRYEYWVLMTTPTGAGSAGVVIDVVKAASRRRAVTH
jgi:hypothetical protein